MKLNKEDIYINLQGKSREELTELEQITGLSNLHHWNYIHFDTYNNYNGWILYDYSTTVKNKQEVTINQLKEILQPMENKEFDLSMCRVQVDKEEQAKQLQELAFKQGFEWVVSGKKIDCLNKKCFYFDTKDYSITHSELNHVDSKFKEIHFNDIFKETLEEQLEKAKAEVKRLEDEIGKPKVGDWYSNKVGNYCFKFGKEHSETTVNKFDFFKKITDQELINKLNNLIK